jgi:ParB family chromosome partitioning protein
MAEKTQKIGLGRGFGSLIPQNFDNSILLDESERVQKLDITKVVANSEQPRQHFDDSALKELSQSIKNHGVLLPLVVTATKDGGYRIVAGERRWRAAKLAKLQTVPAIVRTLKELEELEIALVENVQRVDLSPLEQAISIERLHQQFSIGYDDISKRLGKAYSTVHNIVRLLNLPDDAKAALITHEISEGHARAILALKDQPEQQAQLLASIKAHGWSVRQAERFVSSIKAGIKEEKAAHARVSTETPQTKALSKRLATPVNIRRTAKGGKLEIGFKDDDELARIVSLLDQ